MSNKNHKNNQQNEVKENLSELEIALNEVENEKDDFLYYYKKATLYKKIVNDDLTVKEIMEFLKSM